MVRSENQCVDVPQHGQKLRVRAPRHIPHVSGITACCENQNADLSQYGQEKSKIEVNLLTIIGMLVTPFEKYKCGWR
jgi:hypothetical protein